MQTRCGREFPTSLSELRRLGVKRALLLSGDQYSNVRAVADEIGIREAAGDLLPEQKVHVVQDLVKAGEYVAMIGDGTNDAPALSTATVGIALASQGGGITAEAADVVILVDDLSRVAEGVRISQRTMRIARQSIWFGLGAQCRCGRHRGVRRNRSRAGSSAAGDHRCGCNPERLAGEQAGGHRSAERGAIFAVDTLLIAGCAQSLMHSGLSIYRRSVRAL